MENSTKRQMKLLKFLMVFLLSLMLVGCEADDGLLNNGLLGSLTTNSSSSIDLNSIPKYNGEEFVAINNNVPNVTSAHKKIPDINPGCKYTKYLVCLYDTCLRSVETGGTSIGYASWFSAFIENRKVVPLPSPSDSNQSFPP